MTAGINIQMMTDLQQNVHERSLGHAMTTYTALQALAQVIGMGVVSLAAAHFGVVQLLVFDGLLSLLSGGLAWARLAKTNIHCIARWIRKKQTQQK